MSKKKKGKVVQFQPISPEKYIREHARKWPIYECLINDDWQEKGLATILISREKANGNYVVGSYLVDIFCLGLKQTMYFNDMDEDDYEDELKEQLFQYQDIEECDYDLVHNIIYGGIEYAGDLGFSPEKDWKTSQYILEEDSDDVPMIEIEFGQNGQPMYMVGPYDNPARVIATLEKAVGKDGFGVTNTLGDDNDVDEDFDDYEFADGFEVETFANSQAKKMGLPDSLKFFSYQITEDYIEHSYSKYGHEIGMDKVEDLCQLMKDKPAKAITQLLPLIEKYPEYPVLYNYLYNSYELLRKTADAEAILNITVEKFPDYLFGKIVLAKRLMSEGKHEEAFERAMNGCVELAQLYPHRREFHVSEMLSFCGIVIEYFLYEGKIDLAEQRLDIMKKIDEEHPIVKECERLIEREKSGEIDLGLLGNLRALLKKSESRGRKKKEK